MIGRLNIEPPQQLLDLRSDPDARAVLEDFRLSNGERVTRLGVAHWIFDRRAAADDDAAADDAAAAAADDAADAAADAARLKASNLLAILIGELDVKEGLKIIQMPGRYYYKVTKVGWLKRIAGDEYELVGACTIVRTSGGRHLDELASEGPKKDHRVFKPSKAAEDIHRLSILRCLQADEKVWAESCPKPKDWV